MYNEQSRAAEATCRICGNTDMAGQIRLMDWSRTPLGPLAQWSEALVACVNLMLASPNTFALYWGPEQTLLYNDEYRGLLHEKHPSALGKPGYLVWTEAWPVIGPQIRAAFKHEVTTSVSDAFIPILADGKMRSRIDHLQSFAHSVLRSFGMEPISPPYAHH